MLTITFEFEDGALYRFTEPQDEFSPPEGTWTAPFPNTQEDSVVFGLLESWGQAPDSPVFALMMHHGEPTKVTIAQERS